MTGPAVTPPDADYLLVGKGSVYFNRFDANGVGEGLRHLGNVDRLEITTEDDTIDKYSNMTKDAPLYKRVTRRRTVNFAMTLTEFDPHNLALVLMGRVEVAPAQAAGATTETLTTALKLGSFYKFSKLGPHTGISVSAGATVLTLYDEATGVGDYRIVDTRVGIVQILAAPDTAAVVDGATISATYTSPAYALGAVRRIIGGTEGKIEGSLLFVGDPSSGPAYQVEVWKVSIAPDGALGLISDEFADVGIRGGVLADPTGHPTEKLYRVTELPYVAS